MLEHPSIEGEDEYVEQGKENGLASYTLSVGHIWDSGIGYVLNDAPINPNPTDKIHVEFKNNKDEVVATFEETGTSRIDIVMNQEISNKFKEGVYSILVKYNGEYVTTLLKNSKVVVE